MALLLILCLFAVHVVSGTGVIKLDFTGRVARADALVKRANPVFVGLYDYVYDYLVPITIGTPGQSFELLLDTEADHIWVSASDNKFCAYYECFGTFNPASSSTYVDSGTLFNFTYNDFSGDFSGDTETWAAGSWFLDSVSIGAATVANIPMGLAHDQRHGAGVLGLAPHNQATCPATGSCTTWVGFLEQLVAQKQINSRTFSLWLNDARNFYGSVRAGDYGSILFGGLDTSKLADSLVTLPMVSNSSFDVQIYGMGYADDNGAQNAVSLGYPLSIATLAAGTPVTVIPPVVFDTFTSAYHFPIQYNETMDSYVALCEWKGHQTTVTFFLGNDTANSGRKIIRIPISEFLLPTFKDDNRTIPETFANGSSLCEFGIRKGDIGSHFTLGETFLRSAYVVYDVDNRQISVANIVHNATTANSGDAYYAIPAGSAGVAGLVAQLGSSSTPSSSTLKPTSPATSSVLPTTTPTTTTRPATSTSLAGSSPSSSNTAGTFASIESDFPFLATAIPSIGITSANIPLPTSKNAAAKDVRGIEWDRAGLLSVLGLGLLYVAVLG